MFNRNIYYVYIEKCDVERRQTNEYMRETSWAHDEVEKTFVHLKWKMAGGQIVVKNRTKKMMG